MTCAGCQTIRRVLGIKKEPTVKPTGIFPDGLTPRQRLGHLSLSITLVALGLGLLVLVIRG